MAENEQQDAQERTEQATPKRLQEAREKGQVPRSRELSTMLVLLAGAIMLSMGGAGLTTGMEDLFRAALSQPREWIFDPLQSFAILRDTVVNALLSLTPFLLLMAIVAVAAPVALGGWVMNFEQAAPQLERLDPLKGMKRVFGVQGLFEMLKALAKFLLIMGAAAIVLYFNMDRLILLGQGSVEGGIAQSARMVATTFVIVACVTIVIAVFDVPYQLWQYARNLRMSRQQVKEELKSTEGNPEVRRRIRQIQQEMATRRMMQEVPKADVVVTNPEHYAVALRYNPDEKGAPRVVAKGTDLIAQRIREVAQQHGVTCLTAPPLARALFHSTRLDQEIPAGLYVAVAKVLVYVFQLRDGFRAEPPAEIPIPPELQK